MATDGVRPLQGAVAVLELLAEETRLRLLFLLCEGEANVTELCARLRRPQPAISHHLGILRRSSLVLDRRDGKSVFYRLADPVVGNGALCISRDGMTVTVTLPVEKGHPSPPRLPPGFPHA
jgi:DNA-binding transcriptional ArsR family regulator